MDYDSTPSLQQHATWASRALALRDSRDANAVSQALLTTLEELRLANAVHRCEHPASQVLIGTLAEMAGLQFRWPSAADHQCRQYLAKHRAASSCIELPKLPAT